MIHLRILMRTITELRHQVLGIDVCMPGPSPFIARASIPPQSRSAQVQVGSGREWACEARCGVGSHNRPLLWDSVVGRVERESPRQMHTKADQGPNRADSAGSVIRTSKPPHDRLAV